MSKRTAPLACGCSFGNPAASPRHAHQSRNRLRSLAAPVEPNHGPASGSRLSKRPGPGQHGRRLPGIMLRNGKRPGKKDAIAIMAELHARHEGETMRRKASSVLGWLKWILGLPEDDW